MKGQIVCELCSKTFSGDIPYNEHLKSVKHLRKMMNKSPNSENYEVYQRKIVEKTLDTVDLEGHLNIDVNNKKESEETKNEGKVVYNKSMPVCKCETERMLDTTEVQYSNTVDQKKSEGIKNEKDETLEFPCTTETLPEITKENYNEIVMEGCSICGIFNFIKIESVLDHLKSDEHVETAFKALESKEYKELRNVSYESKCKYDGWNN